MCPFWATPPVLVLALWVSGHLVIKALYSGLVFISLTSSRAERFVSYTYHLCYYLNMFRGTAFSYWFTGTLYIRYMLIPVCHTCSLSGSPLPAFFCCSEFFWTTQHITWHPLKGDIQKVRNGASFSILTWHRRSGDSGNLEMLKHNRHNQFILPESCRTRALGELAAGFPAPYHFVDRSLLFLSSKLK